MTNSEESALTRLAGEMYYKHRINLEVSQYHVDMQWPLHWHDFFELELVLSGTGSQFINGVQHEMQKGSLYLLTPIDFHGVYPEEKLEIINVKFSQDLLGEELESMLYECQSTLLATLSAEALTKTEQELLLLREELNAQEQGNRIIIQATLQRLLVELLRKSQKGTGKQDSSRFILCL